MSDEEDPPECSSCGAKGVKLTNYNKHGLGLEVDLCDLCANSPAGNAAVYPGQNPHGDVLQTICFVGNEILKELRKR